MKEKKISWRELSLMAFTTVWGFGNVTNGFVYFNGTQAIFSWILIFALYFVPYALMVGELGSAFKDETGGVSAWICRTVGGRAAYYAGWTYWACHITYIASKASNGLKALSWAIFRNASAFDSLSPIAVQLMALAVLMLSCLLACAGINPLKKLLAASGTSMFVMSLLYILLVFAAPVLNPSADLAKANFGLRGMIPHFGIPYVTSLSILVFAVGGCEKISPYVNKVDEPGKNFPRGMLALALMVAVCATLGTIALGRMFDPSVINADRQTFNAYVANSAYWAFQKLGALYHAGDFLLIIYALCNAICQFAVLVLSIDAPLRMLLDNENNRRYVPRGLLVTNRNGVYRNGVAMVAVLSGAIIFVQSFGSDAAGVISQLTKLNSICMPMRYLWVFAAYAMLQRTGVIGEYKFVRNKTLAFLCGAWCFAVTAVCCVSGMYDGDAFVFATNVVTPFVLAAIGIVLPLVRRRQERRLRG